MKCSLGISYLLEEISIFPLLLFSSISLHWSLRKAFLSLLGILWNSAFRWVYPSFSPFLSFASLLFSAICKPSWDSHLAVLHFFFLGMGLITAPCTVSQTSIHSSSGTLSDQLASNEQTRRVWLEEGEEVRDGWTEGSSAIGDRGQAAILLTSDVDGTRSYLWKFTIEGSHIEDLV